jgi:hypothetical protein
MFACHPQLILQKYLDPQASFSLIAGAYLGEHMNDIHLILISFLKMGSWENSIDCGLFAVVDDAQSKPFSPVERSGGSSQRNLSCLVR